MKFEYNVAIDVPQERVWEILSDVISASSLMPGVQSVVQQPDGQLPQVGQQGDLQMGAGQNVVAEVQQPVGGQQQQLASPVGQSSP